MTLRELCEAIRDFEKRPPDEAGRVSQLFLMAVVTSAPTGLARAFAVLDANPGLSTSALMKAARVPSSVAIRAQTAMVAMCGKSVPPATMRFLAGTVEDASAIDVPVAEVIDAAPIEDTIERTPAPAAVDVAPPPRRWKHRREPAPVIIPEPASIAPASRRRLRSSR